MANITKEQESKLHKLCRDGNLKKIREFVEKLDEAQLAEKLANREGVFGYTPLHEAVARGKADVLEYLLEKTNNTLVNSQANSGYTPLHLAASSGHAQCVRKLLEHSAGISITDEYGKTPKQTAELSSKASIVQLLRSEEIIKEAETDGEKLTELLHGDTDQLEPNCLERALMAATQNDNHFNIGKLVRKGAKNLEDCLEFAQRQNKPYAHAMLMLIKAASSGNKAIVQKLFGGTVDPDDSSKDLHGMGFAEVQRAVLSGKISTMVPIEIARRNGHLQVLEELLLKTEVNQEEGYVYWHGLRLLQLEVSWLRWINWVKRLRLARNGFKTLPNDMGDYLKQVVKIELQQNELSKIPACLLELPRLGALNLSHNQLTKIPDVPVWSACLTVLDLSHNQLTTLPIIARAPVIRSLNLSHNKFRRVPLCICSFVTLHSLNLSDNPDILTLPAEMGRLNMLNRLCLNNLKDLKDPPKILQKDTHDCIRYLNSKLCCTKGFHRMKLMLVGMANQGKTTLIKRLQGKECGNEPTVGVDVSEWCYKPSLEKMPFHFSIWDFSGQQEYYATHQCFLSQRSLYLLVFNLNDGDAGVQELKPWLNNIALRAPHSCIIIIGTHLDEVPEDKREEINILLNRVGILAETYQTRLQIVEVMPVGLKNRIENVGILKDAIYNHTANYKTREGQQIMGQMIPASYLALVEQLEHVQQYVRQGLHEPIMHVSEFKSMVLMIGLTYIQDEEDLKTATLFLTDIGSLLHYDDRSHNLHEHYYIDPRWLCDVMSKVVTIKERNPFVKNGILYSKDIPLLIKKDHQLPWKYFLTLLDRFEIALLLDNQRRVLIPSMLPQERPKHLSSSTPLKEGLVYSRYILFNEADTPPGFWDRLLSRIMHSIPQVRFALDKTVPSTLAEDMGAEDSDPHVDLGFSLSMQPSTATGPQLSFDATFATPAQPEISCLMKQDHQDHSNLLNAPQLLPNFPNSLPIAMQESYDVKDIQLDYWRTGLYYSDPEPLMFRIESLAKSSLRRCDKKDGVLIVASPNNHGKKIIGQLVDLVLSLIHEWYPGLAEGPGLEQMVPCFECLKQGRLDPFEFKVVEHCMPEISKNRTTIECGYHKNDPATNHTVSLADIVPDLLLQDINPNFLLPADDISYQEDETSLLGKAGYGKVYRGKCQNKSVAIKRYITMSEDTFTELHSEAKLLQQLHHPCLICLVGVCMHPNMVLVLEEAPLKSLEFPILKEKVAVHRLTIFRIAAEVAAALRFLHGQGIIFQDLKAANVLLWTLDPASLCHCKVTDFGITTHMAPVGVRSLQGSKGFIAPEVLRIAKRRQQSVYDHKADIFSFGMFLYQLIARRHPYHDIPPHMIDVSVEGRMRPTLQDVDVASTGYHYLTMLMKKCWEGNRKNRPTTEQILKTVCLASVQSVMCVFPVKSRFSLRHAIALTPANFIEAGMPPKLQNELWVCCDGVEGADLNVYNSHTMVKTSEHFIRDNQVQCMALCNDHVWVGSRPGIEYGVIDIFNIATHELVHNIRMQENSVSCLTAARDRVLIGTLEGYCFSFSNDVASVCNNAEPKCKYVSEHAVNGIACTHKFIWVSHTCYIFFLNPESLALEGSVSRAKERDAFIGQLSASPDEDIIWSAHLGGVILTAWDTHNHSHSFDIDASKVLMTQISKQANAHDAMITAMLPALDTVWLGMATGHIMIFHKEELLTWYQPYTEYVRFLSLIPGSGPCEMEKCMVMSGGKGFMPLVDNMDPDYEKKDNKDQPLDKAGVLVVWEAYEARTMRQVKLIEENAPGYLDNHNSVCMMIHNGDFKDGTHINKAPQGGEKTHTATSPPASLTRTPSPTWTTSPPPSPGGWAFEEEEAWGEGLGVCTGRRRTPWEGATLPVSPRATWTASGNLDSHKVDSKNFFTENAATGAYGSGSSTQKLKVSEEGMATGHQLSGDGTLTVTITTHTHGKEMFEIILHGSEPESEQVVCVTCPRPPQLKVLLSELQLNSSLSEADCKLEYQCRSGEFVRLNSQKQLEAYLALPTKPKLFVAIF